MIFQKLKVFAGVLFVTFAIGLCIKFTSENVDFIRDLNLLESVAVYHFGILINTFLNSLVNNTESEAEN